MKREIKFRVWKPSLSQYLPGTFTPYNWLCNTNSEDDTVFEQFTGLKDAKGQDIYEGDLVKYTINGDTRTSDVIWESACFKVFYKRRKLSDLIDPKIGLRVVSNMHESPPI